LEATLVVSSILLWLIVLANVFLTLALIRRLNAQSPQSEGLASGTQAPDFEAESLDGDVTTLATFTSRGHNLALLFISTHCGPCRDLLTALAAKGAPARQADTELLVVSGDEREETKALMEELGLEIPVLIAPQKHHPFFPAYKISMTPSYCLLDAQGKVQEAGIASSNGKSWQAITAAWEPDAVAPVGERR
jgi:peroxiredoxin